MRWYSTKATGQSTVEFVLIAPLLFLIFFAIIQLSYMAYASFAVQRAALAVARMASLSGIDNSTTFQTQLAISLVPLSNLNQKTLLTVLESDCKVNESPDKKKIVVQVRYPMPIWVPVVGNVFGETLVPSADYNNSPAGQAIKTIFSMLKRPIPDLSFKGVRLPVYWINFEAATFDEAYGHP